MQSISHFERPHAPLHASLIGRLDAAAQARLLDGATLRSFSAGQLIQQHGDDAAGCWLVEQGRVKLGLHTAGGSFVVLTILGPGESYGELSLLRRAPRTVDAMALGAARLRWIEAAHFERILAEEPAILRELTARLGDVLDYALGRLVSERSLTAGQRLAGLLADLAEHEPVPCRLPLTQHDLAELIGVSRVTVGTILSQLAGQGAIAQRYGAIEVVSPALLRGLAASA